MTLPLALLAGLVSFASPCFLPIVPVFVGYLVGTPPADPRQARRVAVRQACTFVVGFGLVFVALWASLGLVGHVLTPYRGALRVLGGVVLLVMGLHVAGLISIPVLDRTFGARTSSVVGGPGVDPATLTPSTRRSLLLGMAFGAGWTPCIGPILGAVIGMAAASESVAYGTLLLVVYALGLGVPFVLVAAGAGELGRRLGWFRRHHVAVSLASGALLMLTGFALVSNVFSRLAGFVPAFVV